MPQKSSADSSSSTGLASLTAIAALGNPRLIPKSKTVILDAQIYVGSPFCEFLIGALRFFNSSNIQFSEEPSLYSIHATVSAVSLGPFFKVLAYLFPTFSFQACSTLVSPTYSSWIPVDSSGFYCIPLEYTYV